ncbi:MAG: hypothetical protein JWM09_1229 [Francisellaceae bacterium]|nr:hypothetical protein [Francisellaceae bacterium]
MRFIETPIFTKIILGILDDNHHRSLQEALVLNPDCADLILGSGGLRKIRWALEGRGKRGRSRIIYYWKKKADQIFFLLAYPKNLQENLTKEQLKKLKLLVIEELSNE